MCCETEIIIIKHVVHLVTDKRVYMYTHKSTIEHIKHMHITVS